MHNGPFFKGGFRQEGNENWFQTEKNTTPGMTNNQIMFLKMEFINPIFYGQSDSVAPQFSFLEALASMHI